MRASSAAMPASGRRRFSPDGMKKVMGVSAGSTSTRVSTSWCVAADHEALGLKGDAGVLVIEIEVRAEA